MLKFIENVLYIKRLSLSKNEYFELKISDDKNIIKYIDNNMDLIQKDIQNKLVEEYLNKLLAITNDWNDKYENNNVIDGMEWDLEIKFKNGEVKKYFGKNDFPINFKYLDIIKNEIIGE